MDGHNLKRGISTNCGCLRQHAEKHGFAPRENRSRTYSLWKGMRSRCKPTSKARKNYYERGISVCARWDDYALFLEDMGECPPGLTLDRIDNDLGYSPENCRWTDMGVQRHNQRRVSWVEYEGETMTVKAASERLGVHPAAIWNEKRRNGGTAQEALDRVVARRS